MFHNPVRLASLAALAALVSACSENGVEPVETPAELSQLLSQATSSGAPTGLVTGLPTVTVPGTCLYASATSTFACPPQTAGGVTVSRSYQLLDGSGMPQSSFSPSVVSIRVSTDISGTVTPPAVPGAPFAGPVAPATIQRSETVTLTGLGATSQRTLNGTSTTTISTSVSSPGESLPIAIAGADTISNLVLPASPGSAASPNFPLSGSVINNHAVTAGTPPLSFTHRVRMATTFNGTSTVSVSMTVNGQTTTCSINVAQRPPVCS